MQTMVGVDRFSIAALGTALPEIKGSLRIVIPARAFRNSKTFSLGKPVSTRSSLVLSEKVNIGTRL